MRQSIAFWLSRLTTTALLFAACSGNEAVSPTPPPALGDAVLRSTGAFGYSATPLPLPHAAPGACSTAYWPCYDYGVAADINDAGAIAGWVLDYGNGNQLGKHATKWVGNTPTMLPHPLRVWWTAATAINPLGEVVGWGSRIGGIEHVPIKWTAGGTPIVLPLAGGPYSGSGEAHDINASGLVVGNDFVGGLPRAVKWQNGTMVIIAPPGTSQSAARSVNRHGDIAGWIAQPSGSATAYVWKANGTQFALQLPGSYAYGISDNGVVVGFVGQNAFLWSTTTGTQLLNWGPSVGRAVSYFDRVVGHSYGTGAGTPYNAFTHRAGLDETLQDPASGRPNYGAEALGVNACGSIVGSFHEGLYKRPVIWTKARCDVMR